ncbi:MAG TPA: aldehyde dehydrogenase [Acidimicrobiales bacterium]|nr:aldehyde dehydrogenase [Acidimicrobiales bacterium]
MDRHELYVGGAWAAPRGGERLTVVSPHTGRPIATAPAASTDDVDTAVALARQAFDEGEWPRTPPAARAEVVARLGARYAGQLDEMAAVISSENGSPLTFSQFGQVGAVPRIIDGYLEAAAALAWEDDVPGAFGGARVLREPVGVVAAITAWNVPQILIVAKLVPALLAGCCVVVKAAPESPLDALLLADLIDGCGFPPGVVSILPGGVEAGRRLVAHPSVDKVTFTGSTAVGREIGAVCGEQLKRVSLELGGKSAAIVLDDADLARTAAGLRFASYMNNGQACAAQTRVLVPRSRHGEAVEALADAVRSFVVGDPLDPATEIGPLVSERQRDRVQGYVELGLAEGARRVVGGEPLPPAAADGWYVAPTLFADVDNRMRIAQEEIFGPVVVVVAYEDDDDAVRLANDSIYGLGGSVWTADKTRGLGIARRVRTGTFGVNSYGPDVVTPFGGYKSSGLGREYGTEGLQSFVELKCVHGI